MNVTFPSKNWTAWHDFMPGSKPTLHVKGEVTCPTPGYSATLVPHTPQGINPHIYLLDLVVCPPAPGQIVPQVLTDLPVQYQEETESKFETVTILPGDITIEVQIVSQAAAAGSPPPESVPAGTRMILAVESVVLSVASVIGRVKIEATGTVRTGGWTAGKLTDTVNPPKDGKKHLDFIATPPTGMATQAISPIGSAPRTVQAHAGTFFVVVHAETNQAERSIDMEIGDPSGPEVSALVEADIAAPTFTPEQAYEVLKHAVYPPCKKQPDAIRIDDKLDKDLGYIGSSRALLAPKTNQAFAFRPANRFNASDFDTITAVGEHHAAVCAKLKKEGRLV